MGNQLSSVDFGLCSLRGCSLHKLSLLELIWDDMDDERLIGPYRSGWLCERLDVAFIVSIWVSIA